MEADFQREYHIDLWDALDAGMTFRRFTTLLGGLSANSVWRLVQEEAGRTASTSQALDQLWN